MRDIRLSGSDGFGFDRFFPPLSARNPHKHLCRSVQRDVRPALAPRNPHRKARVVRRFPAKVT
jgi:hypothetical protein